MDSVLIESLSDHVLTSIQSNPHVAVVTCSDGPRIAAQGRRSALAYAEIRLVAWAHWAKGDPERLGYPQLSLIYKVMRRRAKRLGLLHRLELRIKELTARGSETRSLRPRSVGEVSVAIEEVDRAVAALNQETKQIIDVEYLGPEYPEEIKASNVGLSVMDYRKTLKRAKLMVAERLS